jgi:PAS domain S-box-containing protein
MTAARQSASPEDRKINAINQRIFETSLDLIMVVDKHGNFIRLSPSTQAIIGYDPQELVGRSAAEILYPDDLESTRDEMRRARRGGVIRHFPCRYIHKDGHIVTLTWTGVWSPGEQQHFFIGRDVTELNETERRLREAHAAQEQAVSANLAKSRFLATASHDLRQPLHAMNLFISALRRRVDGDEATRLVDGMAAATASMQSMFNAVLDVTKLEAGAVTPASPTSRWNRCSNDCAPRSSDLRRRRSWNSTSQSPWHWCTATRCCWRASCATCCPMPYATPVTARSASVVKRTAQSCGSKCSIPVQAFQSANARASSRSSIASTGQAPPNVA